MLKNLRLKLISLCLFVIAAVISVIHFATYVTTMDAIERRLILSARGVAIAMADHITMNIEAYKEFSETRDITSDYYKRMQEHFRKVKENGEITYIYTERRLNADTVEFILDAEIIGSENYSAPGDLDTNEARKEQIYITGQPNTYRFAEGSIWGDLVVSYAPIFDRDGSIIGLLGVDVDAQAAFSQLRRMQGILFITYAVILGLITVLLIRYSNAFLEHLLKDKLTGAYSKRYLDKLLKDEIKSARKDKREEITIMLLDLDHFKNINDTYGHEFGDKVLRTVSKVIKEVIRQEDYFIRYGGEEFVIIITKSPSEQVLDIANRIRKAVEDMTIFNEEHNKYVKITISIGVGSMQMYNIIGSELIERADKALYVAKKDRNSVALMDDKQV